MHLPPVLALDIGGTKLAAAVVTHDGRTHGFAVEPTRREDGPGRIIHRLFALGQRAVDAAGLPEVAAVGISCGGPLDSAAGILKAPLHLPGWIDVPIVAMARAHFGVPALLENDATAAALGEHRHGAGRGTSTMIYLTISTGIGGGAVIDGRLHRGAAGNGGEFGHVLVRTGGRACLCGRNGCLEVYASGTSIAARAREAVAERGQRSALVGLVDIRAEDVVAAMRAGDPLATEIWNETTQLLAVAITDLVNVIEPEVVVLGGGVAEAGEDLIGPVRLAVKRSAMRPAAEAVRVELAALANTSPAVGAAAAAFDRFVTGRVADAGALAHVPTAGSTAKEETHA